MAIKVTELKREFSHNDVILSDIKGASLDKIPTFYSGIYPELKDSKLEYVSTKNNVELYRFSKVGSKVVKNLSPKETSNTSSLKGSTGFKKVIEDYLSNRAATDELFAKTFLRSNKNLDDCVTYILNTVKKSGNTGFSDSEIFGMAVHYYDEEDLKPGPKVKAKVIINRSE